MVENRTRYQRPVGNLSIHGAAGDLTVFAALARVSVGVTPSTTEFREHRWRFYELLGNPEGIDDLACFRNLLQAESLPLYIYHAQRMDLRDELVGEGLPTGRIGLLFGIV